MVRKVTRRLPRRTTAACVAALSLVGRDALAEPYRLRIDAYADAPDPAAFVMVQAEARADTALLFDAEALVWTGVGVGVDGAPEARGEAVIAAFRLRDPAHGLGLRFGRLLYHAGAVSPLHIDGGVASARSDTGTAIEVFGGMPVVSAFQARTFDWVVGARGSQDIAGVATVGYSYWQQRTDGRIARSELGVDGALSPHEAFALTATAAIDTERFGVAEARVSALFHRSFLRLELFGTRRSPSRMLPATSLFAALGSYDSDQLGVSGFVRPAPRLDLSASATLDRVGDEPGATQELRAELRLDDDGRGALGLEGRRFSIPDASWTGIRAFARVPFGRRLAGSAELEVAVPDAPKDRGVAWPWALLGIRWTPLPTLEAAGALEVSSSPAYDVSFGGRLRLSGTWQSP